MMSTMTCVVPNALKIESSSEQPMQVTTVKALATVCPAVKFITLVFGWVALNGNTVRNPGAAPPVTESAVTLMWTARVRLVSPQLRPPWGAPTLPE